MESSVLSDLSRRHGVTNGLLVGNDYNIFKDATKRGIKRGNIKNGPSAAGVPRAINNSNGKKQRLAMNQAPVLAKEV